MGASVINDFSKALISLAEQKQNVAAIQRAAEELLPLLKHPEVRQFLNHPTVKAVDKKVFLSKIIPTEAPQEFINFVHLITDRRYTPLLPDILDRTIDLAVKVQGSEVVTIITAREISPEEENSIRMDLEKRWSTRIFLKKRHNPNLIGGIIIQREDELFDGSVLGQIKSLRRKLTEKSVI
ncbi:MAG TPA: ATP synthase F1 subunit delta [Bacillota bacterium]|nr:ATP synthase F1 subunit delta [Bacillota bacterium]